MRSWKWFNKYADKDTINKLTNNNLGQYDLKIIGVTGTVGKTTVAELTSQYLNYIGKRTFYIGTSGINCPAANYWHFNFPSTSPTSQEMLATFMHGAYAYSCEYLVIEVTAETIAAGIYKDLDFECIAFTNLKRNIVRSFKNDNIYFNAKLSILHSNKINCVLSSNKNKDLIKLLSKINVKSILFDYDYQVDDDCKLSVIVDGITYDTNLLSSINADNVALFYNIIKTNNLLDTDLFSSFLKTILIPGRLERFTIEGRNFIIDTGYGGVEGLTPFFEESKAKPNIAVMSSYFFDNSNDTAQNLINKRKSRAALVAKYCDKVYLTATHRRTGNSTPNREQCVIDQLQLGAPNAIQIYNRMRAIEKACLESNPGDTIIVLGMGSETWGEVDAARNIYIGDKDFIEMVFNQR